MPVALRPGALRQAWIGGSGGGAKLVTLLNPKPSYADFH
jgi:hypothetical protein